MNLFRQLMEEDTLNDMEVKVLIFRELKPVSTMIHAQPHYCPITCIHCFTNPSENERAVTDIYMYTFTFHIAAFSWILFPHAAPASRKAKCGAMLWERKLP